MNSSSNNLVEPEDWAPGIPEPAIGHDWNKIAPICHPVNITLPSHPLLPSLLTKKCISYFFLTPAHHRLLDFRTVTVPFRWSLVMHIRKLAQTAGPLFLSILLPDSVFFVFCAKISFQTHCVLMNHVRRFFACLGSGCNFFEN